MTNLYVATRVLTFFGTVMRAFWEQVVCRICAVPVEDVRAFKVSELCGHVEHELIKKKSHIFLVCWLPFTLNFILSCCFLLSGAYRVVYVVMLRTLLTGRCCGWEFPLRQTVYPPLRTCSPLRMLFTQKIRI